MFQGKRNLDHQVTEALRVCLRKCSSSGYRSCSRSCTLCTSLVDVFPRAFGRLSASNHSTVSTFDLRILTIDLNHSHGLSCTKGIACPALPDGLSRLSEMTVWSNRLCSFRFSTIS